MKFYRRGERPDNPMLTAEYELPFFTKKKKKKRRRRIAVGAGALALAGAVGYLVGRR